MADADSLLAIQQKGALEIPYKNIEQFQQKLDSGMNAWRVGQELQLRRGALQKQLEQMALRNQQQQFMNEIREANYQRQLQQGQQRLDIAEQNSQLRSNMDSFAMQKYSDKMDQQQKSLEDTQAAEQYLLESGATVNDATFPQAVRSARVLFPAAKLDSEKLIDRFNTHSTNREKASYQEEKTIVDQAKAEVFHNQPVDAGLFLNPSGRVYQLFETEPSDAEKSQGVTPTPWVQGVQKRKDAATGSWTNSTLKVDRSDPLHPRYIPVKDKMGVMFPAQGTSDPYPTYIPIAIDKMRDYQSRLKAVMEERAKIPSPAAVDSSPSNVMRIYSRDELNRVPPNMKVIYHNPDTDKDELWQAPSR